LLYPRMDGLFINSINKASLHKLGVVRINKLQVVDRAQASMIAFEAGLEH
jgi:hypothetical protein